MKTKRKPISTASVLAGMLREDTGKSLLDSGGAYGRNYERNQKRAFEKQPASVLNICVVNAGTPQVDGPVVRVSNGEISWRVDGNHYAWPL